MPTFVPFVVGRPSWTMAPKCRTALEPPATGSIRARDQFTDKFATPCSLCIFALGGERRIYLFVMALKLLPPETVFS